MESKIYDICIIGAGPAGIILALEYARLNPTKKLLLVEYGHQEQPDKNDLDDSIIIKNTINHHSPYESTNKGLGGSSATWGGRCVLYDEVDFIDRPVIAGNCTWDMGLFNEVLEYNNISAKYFECGEPIFNLNDTQEFNNKRIAEGFKEGIVKDSIIERWSMPTRFGKRYEKELKELTNLTLMLGFEARDFGNPIDGGKISTLSIRDTKTKRLTEITAQAFVITAGAQETTRILLRNTQLFDQLQSVPAALGKYYQGHLSGKIASVRFKGDPAKTEYGFLRNKDGSYIRRRFQFDDNFLVDNDLLNTAIWLDNPLYYDPKHRSGAMSFMYLAMITPIIGKKLAPPAIAHSITKGEINGVKKHIFNILRQFPKSILTPAIIFYKRYCLSRKLPGVFLFSPDNTYALHFHSEQVPDEKNCMELGADKESLIINLELSDADIESIIKVHEILDDWLKKCDCGELEYWFDKGDLKDAIRNMSKDGIHQSGTTRIAKSPEKGVVDYNLKIWGTQNVFVCSSSVFPTSGQANPTFFLGSFAARLANYLTYHEKN